MKACLPRVTTTFGILWAVCIRMYAFMSTCGCVFGGMREKMNKANMCVIGQRRGKTQRLKQTTGNMHTHKIEIHSLNAVCRFNLTASRQTKSLISSHLSLSLSLSLYLSLSLSEVSGDELKGGWCALAAISVTNTRPSHTHVHTHTHANACYWGRDPVKAIKTGRCLSRRWISRRVPPSQCIPICGFGGLTLCCHGVTLSTF